MFFYSRSNSGFSLLELMIVLTIIAILAAIAIPNYQLYVKKAKFSEVITHVAPYKTAVDICAELLGELGNGEDNCGTAGRHEIPPIFTASGNKGSVARIETEYQSPDVLIKATTQGLGDEYTYVLRAHIGENAQVEWSVDASSTCLAAGLCHAS